MLRIKKEIDLKELEKKGFKKDKLYGIDVYSYEIFEKYSKIIIANERIIAFYAHEEYCLEEDLNILYDLITAGYVEKVEE